MDLSSMTHTLAQSMPTLAMTWNPVLTNILVMLFLVVSGAMILLVLIQRPQGGGLSGAFGAGGGGGGGGAGQTAFGTKTGDVLTIATVTIFALFLLTAIVLNFATRPQVAADPNPAIVAPEGEPQGDAAEAIEEAQDEVQGDMQGDLQGEIGTEPAAETDPQTDPQTGEPGADADDASGAGTTTEEPASSQEQPN